MSCAWRWLIEQTLCMYGRVNMMAKALKYRKKTETIRIQNRIVKMLKENMFFICDICYARGTFAKNSWRSGSDIDLLIVSDDFRGILYNKRKELVRVALDDIGEIIDPICLSRTEFINVLKRENNRFKQERLIRMI